jgi:peptide-methionine (S)-S-oxide reductase
MKGLTVSSFLKSTARAACCITLVACAPSTAEQPAFPDARVDVPADSSETTQTAFLAGGCYWGVEAVFEHVNGVEDVVSGFMNGAESVRITYDPTKVSYGELLKVFFAVAHDPTQLNRQGPDAGPQYRSAIFAISPVQRRAAESYIQQLTDAKIYRKPIVTQVSPAQEFRLATPEHQDYAARNPKAAYIVINDVPKIKKLERDLPVLYKER